MKLNYSLNLVLIGLFLTILSANPNTHAGTPIRSKHKCGGTYNNSNSNNESDQDANPDDIITDNERENFPTVDDSGSEFPDRDTNNNCDSSYGAGGPFSDQF